MVFTVEWCLQVLAMSPAMIYPSLQLEATAVALANYRTDNSTLKRLL